VIAAPAVSYAALLLSSGPRFIRDGAGPVLVFYAGWRLQGLVAGIAAATLFTMACYLWERRRGRTGLAAATGLGVAAVQALAGLATGSATAYFAPGVLAGGLHGLVFLGSVAIGRPLVAVFAREAYPFPEEVRAAPAFRRTFSVISLVWGATLVARSAARLVVLLGASVDAYVAFKVVTGAPVTATLFAWSVWYGLRALARHRAAPGLPRLTSPSPAAPGS
jgi:hypothetical protein